MANWGVRTGLIVIAVQPLITTLLMWLIDGAVSLGTVIAALVCAVVQGALLLWIQVAATERTDALAQATHRELRDAADVDYAAEFERIVNDR